MLTELRYMELHAPFFFGGKNHGLKVAAKDGMRLFLREESGDLVASWKGKVTVISTSTYIHAEPLDPESYIKGLNFPPEQPVKIKPAPTSKPMVAAQVESPHSHVFAGTGAGKSR